MKNMFAKCRIALALGILLMTASQAVSFQLENIEIETFDGRQVTCNVTSISLDGELNGPNVPAGMNVKDILSVRNPDAESTPTRSVQVLLSGGGKIYASEFTTDGQDSTVIAKTVVGNFPLEATRAIIWQESRKVQTALNNRSSENDQVVVDTGSEQVIVSGLLERVTDEKVEINYKGESRKISREIVLAIVTADLQTRGSDKTIGILEMTDGSVIQGGIDQYSDGLVSVLLDSRNSIQVDARLLENVVVKSDRIRFLSTLDPIEFDQRAYFGIERGWKKDLSIEGNPLTLNSTKSENPLVFKRGLGTHSYSRLLFEIPEGFDRFAATVGIDAETDGKGDCELVIQADGVQVWQGRVRAEDEPQSIEVEIEGAQRLTLIVQPGKQFDLSDHLNWCNARFLNTK